MASNGRGYWSRSWELLTRDEGWFKPLLVLAAARLVPIVGAFGANGYGLEWARLTAWGVDSAPKQKNVDVWACIKTGARAFVVGLGYGIAMAVLRLLLTGILGSALGGLLGTALVFVGTILILVAKLRSTIYQTIGAGYQVERIYDIIKRDYKGLLRIVGMIALLAFGFFLIACTLYGIVLFAKMGGWMRSFMEYEFYGYEDDWFIISSMMTSFASALPALLVMSYFVGIFKSAINLLEVTAVGLWMRQFDVPNWGESSDPLPSGTPAPEEGYGVSTVGAPAYGQSYGAPASAAPVDVVEPVKAQAEAPAEVFPIPVPMDNFPTASVAEAEAPVESGVPEPWVNEVEKAADVQVDSDPFDVVAQERADDKDVKAALDTLDQVSEPETLDVPAEPAAEVSEAPAELAFETQETLAESAFETQGAAVDSTVDTSFEAPVESEPEIQEVLAEPAFDEPELVVESTFDAEFEAPAAEEAPAEVPLFSLASVEAEEEAATPAAPKPVAGEHPTPEQVLAQIEAAVDAADMTGTIEDVSDKPEEALTPEAPQTEEIRSSKTPSGQRIIEVIDLTGGAGVHNMQSDEESEEG